MQMIERKYKKERQIIFCVFAAGTILADSEDDEGPECLAVSFLSAEQF